MDSTVNFGINRLMQNARPVLMLFLNKFKRLDFFIFEFMYNFTFPLRKCDIQKLVTTCSYKIVLYMFCPF